MARQIVWFNDYQTRPLWDVHCEPRRADLVGVEIADFHGIFCTESQTFVRRQLELPADDN